MRCVPAIFLCLLFAAPLGAQKEKREPLTEAQVEKVIVEAGRATGVQYRHGGERRTASVNCPPSS